MKKKLNLTIILLIILIVPVFVKAVLNVDINGDGVTDISDVIAIAQKIINKESISSTADVTGDGSVKVNDVMMLLNDVNNQSNELKIYKVNSTASSAYLYLNKYETDASGVVTTDNTVGKPVKTTLKAYVGGQEVTSGSRISWVSSKPGVATIDSNGTVTAVSLGKTTITATDNSTGISAQYTIRVKKKVIIVIGASQVNRLSCYVTDDTYDYAVSKTNHCAGTKIGNNVTYGSIVSGKYKYTTAATSIASVLTTIQNGGSLKRSSLTSSASVSLASYRFSDTLNFIHQSGSGFEFQIGGDDLWTDGALTYSTIIDEEEVIRRSGWDIALEIIRSYEDVKSDVGFYIYFPIAGNATIDYGCKNWSDKYKQVDYQLPSNESDRDDADKFYNFVDYYLQRYKNNIDSVIGEGYHAWGYIVSAHPLVPGNDSSGSIRYSNATDACRAWYTNSSGNKVKGKRSNLKYYLFNEVIEHLVKTKYESDNFQYVDTFNKIMDVTVDNSKPADNDYSFLFNGNGKYYSFKYKSEYSGPDGDVWDHLDDKYVDPDVPDDEKVLKSPLYYKTDDGLHWDKDTVHEYLKLMIQDNTRLS